MNKVQNNFFFFLYLAFNQFNAPFADCFFPASHTNPSILIGNIYIITIKCNLSN